MKFCKQCENMYYIGIDAKDTNKLTYYCRSCGYVDESIVEDGVCIMNTQFKKSEQKFNHIINQNTKLYPTLPRIFNMKCPNPNCKTNTAEEKNPAEIIYMRYDDANLKYLYICVTCDTTWKTDDST